MSEFPAPIVFTNGCFDILHRGHLELLHFAKGLGSTLIVGLNSDASVRALKGPSRPIFNEDDRRFLLEALRPVDKVFVFDTLTPLALIKRVRPHIIVKGGDYEAQDVIGAEYARVEIFPLLEGYSTSLALQRHAPSGLDP